MAVARRLPRAAHRPRCGSRSPTSIGPGALTPTVVLSLGLGLALLVTVIQIDGNLRRQFIAALPDKAPSFYFVDIQSADAERFDAFACASRAAAPRSSACRCCAGASCRSTASMPKTSSRRRTPPGCCKATAASPTRPKCRAGSRVVEGQWWGRRLPGPAAGLVREKDRRRARAQGRRSRSWSTCSAATSTARSPTCARVDWQSLGINFVLVFSPGTFTRRAAHPYRDPDLSGRRHDRRGNRAAQGGERGASRR